MLGSHRGFTLVEAILALALLSIILGIGAPAARQMIHGQQVRKASIDLAAALILSRQEAIMRRSAVVLERLNGDWSRGWRVFVDHNGNSAFDSGDLVLKSGDAIAAGVRISGNTPVSHYVRYMPSGLAKMQNGAFQAGTITLCHEDGQQQLRKLIISATGRLRTVKEAAGSC